MISRIALFYHIWAPNGTHPWTLLVDEQLKRIYRSGLADAADIFCCISGPKFEEVSNLVALYSWAKILEKAPHEDEYEGFTLKHLHEHAQGNHYRYVGYMHTKGLSHMRLEGHPHIVRAVNSWRHMMEAAVIDRWRDALGKLDSHDVAGANVRAEPWLHFSGNFWWATTKYIRYLPHPIHGETAGNEAHSADPSFQNRTNYERWVGINNPTTYDFYNRPFKFRGDRITTTDDFDLYNADVEPFYRANMR